VKYCERQTLWKILYSRLTDSSELQIMQGA
jgi:hypothetical protein